MNTILVFFYEMGYKDEPFWGISNFLSKFTNRKEVMPSDVTEIRSLVIKKLRDRNLDLGRYIMLHQKEGKAISRPENIYQNIEQYDIVFCTLIRMELLADISDLNAWALMKQFYKQFRLILLLKGKTQEYYKASHYLYDMTYSMHDDIFYANEETVSLKRLQRQGVGALGHFLPVQKVNKELLNLFTQPLSDYTDLNFLTKLLDDESDLEQVNTNKIIDSSMKIIHQVKDCFVKDDKREIAAALLKMNILTWIFFVYSLREASFDKETIIKEQVRAYADQMNLYANGCLQLLENIIFHSQRKEGIFSFRIYKKDAEYIIKKYHETIQGTGNLLIEVMVADYSDGNDSENIAQNFLKKLDSDTLREIFADFKPVDFFTLSLDANRRSEVEKWWISYYENLNNIGKHFGIRIFESIISQSKGIFLVESHASHKVKGGESFRREAGNNCLPGTSYMIALPVQELQRDLAHTKIGIDNEIDIENMFHYCMNYIIADKPIQIRKYDYHTQEEKQLEIEKLMHQITEQCSKEKTDIWYLSAEGCNENSAEIFCKAVLMAKYKIDNVPNIVFYNCERDFMESYISITTAVFKNLERNYPVTDHKLLIILFMKDTFDEIILVPDSYAKTVYLNEQLNFSKGIIEDSAFLSEPVNPLAFNAEKTGLIPYDVLFPVNNGKTIFEDYAKAVIERDIQEQAFGCKINDTHMRLGSTIHVDLFYEAELLFGNKLFLSRFAFLVVKDLLNKIDKTDKITIYGYATYSELFVFEIMNMLKSKYTDLDVDYAILERETENRGNSHIDRIRYSTYFPPEKDEEERKKHFKNRKIICIVPVASTLKTNEKLIRLFCENNGEDCLNRILEHYVLVLVGTEDENSYWRLENSRIHGKKNPYFKIPPRFFVEVQLTYEEAIGCRMCFPKNILEERPLIEVNAASTIPNQAFGLYDSAKAIPAICWEGLEKEEASLKCLEDSLVYSHVRRGENHYLYYFQTEKLMVHHCDDVIQWLVKIRRKLEFNINEYHIIFCPSHFSNAGFLEYINRIIFRDAAIIIRDDIDKEYRSNIIAKYSNIQLMFEKLEAMETQERIIKFYYVDDSIITGRSFYRSKSLVESIANLYQIKYQNVQVHIFEKIFVLIDRNSQHSRMQYIRCWDSGSRAIEEVGEDFFAFRTVKISSLRNHGDSCIICKLEDEADSLYKAASTYGMSLYWQKEKEKFKIKSLKNYLQDATIKTEVKKKRGYRRMVCTHICGVYLNEHCHKNRKNAAVVLILQLLITDYKKRREEKFEYFLSYLKCISRPFVVFNKAVKQAVFDILLIIAQWQLTGSSMNSIIQSVEEGKKYLLQDEVKEQLFCLEETILKSIEAERNQQDMLLLVFKQLTELKSNYIIRIETMNRIVDFIKDYPDDVKKKFYVRYLRCVKQLIGVNSDTSKSTWLDFAIHNRKEISNQEVIYTFKMPDEVIEIMYIENARVIYEGIRKLSASVHISENIKENLINNEIHSDGLKALSKKFSEQLTDYQYGNFKEVLYDYGYLCKDEHEDQMEISEKGRGPILSSLVLHQMLDADWENSEKLDILTKCQVIVRMLANIMSAQCVRIVMQADAEYDLWKAEVYEKYNELKKSYCRKHPEVSIMDLENKPNKEYVLLADNRLQTKSMQEFEALMVGRLKLYVDRKSETDWGYQWNSQDGYLIWEMESGSEHPIFIYAEWQEKPTDRFERLNEIRNGMIFNNLLNTQIFSYKNGGQLDELITNSRDLRVSNRSKAFSHTKNDVRMKQYEHICKAEEGKRYYQSDVLTLLADLNVSEIYRKSLKKEYYTEFCSLKTICWADSTSSVFNKNIPYYYIDSKLSAPVKVNVTSRKIFDFDLELKDTDEIICYNVANAGREVFLLLYSLILNVGVEGRSQINDQNEVTAYISKTESGNLRIANMAGKQVRKAEEINEEIKFPPANEEKGISLWSMSRYIKGIICSLLLITNRKLSEVMEAEDFEYKLVEYQKCIQQLLNEDFDVKAAWITYQGQKYFSLEIPILAEKYEKLNKWIGSSFKKGKLE